MPVGEGGDVCCHAALHRSVIGMLLSRENNKFMIKKKQTRKAKSWSKNAMP